MKDDIDDIMKDKIKDIIKDKTKEPIRFTMYIPKDLNEHINFIRYKERISKNAVILEILRESLPIKIKKYPEYAELKNL
ncbi:MAG: hypothetical protein NTV16_03190 [Actinobacteria bacterium]|nr:hypothetical protein [Actinomycetota bacterium]